jgi:hypothetical protein
MYTTEALLRGRLSLRKIDYFLRPPLDYRLLFTPISSPTPYDRALTGAVRSRGISPSGDNLFLL